MPPSPRITATLNQAEYKRLCKELSIPEPSIKFKQTGKQVNGRTCYGVYIGGLNAIEIYLDMKDYQESSKLRFATTEMIRTILHECRHARQRFHLQDIWESEHARETDAEGWAVDNLHRYLGLARLSRSFPNSGFSRLSKHANR
jgi:hypothetical protein